MRQIRDFFQIRFQYIIVPDLLWSQTWYPCRSSKNEIKSDLKSPEIVPFGANLTHFGAKPYVPDPQVQSLLIFFWKKTIFCNFFEKISNFWQFFYIKMAVFRRVSATDYQTNHTLTLVRSKLESTLLSTTLLFHL